MIIFNVHRYAEERKVGALRPSSASLERRLADADQRRKVRIGQKNQIGEPTITKIHTATSRAKSEKSKIFE